MYLAAQAKWSDRRRGRLNAAELAILTTRRGVGVMSWISSFQHSIIDRDRVPEVHQLLEHYERTLDHVLAARIVPKTKAPILALHLSLTLCVTANSLMNFVGLAKSTAHKWMQRCSDAGLLLEFLSGYESYFVNVKLLALVLAHNPTMETHEEELLRLDVLQLRGRINWLAESRVANFIPRIY